MAAKDSYVAVNMYGNMLNGAVVLGSNKETASQDGFYWYKFKASNEKDIVMTLWNDNEDVENVSVNVNLPKGQVADYYRCRKSNYNSNLWRHRAYSRSFCVECLHK